VATDDVEDDDVAWWQLSLLFVHQKPTSRGYATIANNGLWLEVVAKAAAGQKEICHISNQQGRTASANMVIGTESID
jgi:hypothetical protein